MGGEREGCGSGTLRSNCATQGLLQRPSSALRSLHATNQASRETRVCPALLLVWLGRRRLLGGVVHGSLLAHARLLNEAEHASALQLPCHVPYASVRAAASSTGFQAIRVRLCDQIKAPSKSTGAKAAATNHLASERTAPILEHAPCPSARGHNGRRRRRCRRHTHTPRIQREVTPPTPRGACEAMDEIGIRDWWSVREGTSRDGGVARSARLDGSVDWHSGWWSDARVSRSGCFDETFRHAKWAAPASSATRAAAASSVHAACRGHVRGGRDSQSAVGGAPLSQATPQEPARTRALPRIRPCYVHTQPSLVTTVWLCRAAASWMRCSDHGLTRLA